MEQSTGFATATAAAAAKRRDTMTNLTPTALFSAIAIALAAVPVAANAETMSVKVSYADLNLASPAGVAQFDRRIAHAVTTICGVEKSTDDNWPQVRKCRRDALASTLPQRSQALAAAETRRNVEVAAR